MKEDINNYLHKFSKAVVAEGQLYERQAAVKSGHNVDYVTVRGQDIPICQYKDTLLTSTGTVKAAYATTIKYWNKALMTVYPDSNGQAYYLLDDGIVVSDFIDPSDKLIDGRQLSRGYTALVYGVKSDGNDQKISSVLYNFDSYAGILYFEKGKTPTDLGYTGVKIQVFQYIGKTVKQNFKNVEELIAMNLMLLQKLSAERIVVQPYKFSTSNMTTVWTTPKPIPGAFNKFGKQMWCQRFRIAIPGYVFETSAVACNPLNGDPISGMFAQTDGLEDKVTYDNGVIIPDIQHTASGDSIIEIELQVDGGQDDATGTGQVIIGYEDYTDPVTGKPGLKLKVGTIDFIASTFKRNDNQKLDVKPPIAMENVGDTLSCITPDLKEKLLVDQYIVDFSAYPDSKETKQVVSSNISGLLQNVK